MSKENWVKKFEAWKPKSERFNEKIHKEQCKDFERGKNGYCKHYMGCPIVSRTCAEECEVK